MNQLSVSIIVLSLLLPHSALAFDPDPVDWNYGLQRVELDSAPRGNVPAVRKVTSLGVSGGTLAIGFGPAGTGGSHAFNLASATMHPVDAAGASRFKPLPLEYGNYRLALENDNKVVLYDRGVPYTLPEGGLWKPGPVGIAAGRFAVVPWWNNHINIYALNGDFLGSLDGFNGKSIVALAGEGNLLAAACSDGAVYLWDLTIFHEVAQFSTARVRALKVVKGSLAEKYGISEYSDIISIDGKPVTSTADVILALRRAGTITIVLKNFIKDNEYTVTVTKEEGPFGLQIELKQNSWHETIFPLAVLAFGDDNRWLAWTGEWRNFEDLRSRQEIDAAWEEDKRKTIREYIANNANINNTGLYAPRWHGDAGLSKRLATIHGDTPAPVAGLVEYKGVLNQVHDLVAGNYRPPLHDRLNDRFPFRKNGQLDINDRVRGVSWFWDAFWWAGTFAHSEQKAAENGYRLATRDEVLELAASARRAARRHEIYISDRDVVQALERVGFILRGLPLWTSTPAPGGYYVCSIKRMCCIPADPDRRYGALLIKKNSGGVAKENKP